MSLYSKESVHPRKSTSPSIDRMTARNFRSLKIPAFLTLLLFAIPQLPAQTTDNNEDSRLVILPGGEKVFEWFGKPDRTYFMQVSDSNDPLRKWKWAPLIESGNNQYISHEVIGTAAQGFFRLKYTDQPIPAGETIDTADFDGDGVANIDEVSPPYYLPSTDPLNVDTDGDGLDDGRERSLGTDPNKADSDGDGLSDGDEYWIYSSDPTRIDTDGDGLGDGTEVNQTNTSPTIIDTDGDGTSDGDEIKQGTDPKSAASFIVQWHQITRSLSYDFDDYPPPSNRGNLSKIAEWNTALDANETLAAAIPFPDLKARLETLAFPATPPATGGTNEIITSAGQSDLTPNPPCFHATMTHHRLWLRRPSATPVAFNQYALKITERTIDGATQTPVEEVIQVTIPANAAISDPVDLVEGFTQNFTGNTAHSENFTQRLLPMDLDIEYASQAGIKELEEEKEDAGDGGYISLKSQTHQGEDITPTTYLIIRPIVGLPAERKVRLKFNSGGRYKVARDLLGNDPVVSEVTEFPAGQETRIYLVGETKSQSRGGEEITMQIENGGSWIDGDSLKATVIQTQFQLDLRVFIPYNWVNIPHPAHVSQVAKGDSRSYDPQLKGTYRVAQWAILNLYREWVPDVENRMIDNGKSAGTSEHYSDSDVINWDDNAKHSENTIVSPSYIKSGATAINTGTADLSQVDSIIDSISTDDTKCFMNFQGAAAEPIIAGAATIDWRINVGISKNDPLNPQFRMQGVHDGFPAYEIYINSKHQIFQHTDVLQWKPDPAVGVLELIGYPDVTVGPTIGLINQ